VEYMTQDETRRALLCTGTNPRGAMGNAIVKPWLRWRSFSFSSHHAQQRFRQPSPLYSDHAALRGPSPDRALADCGRRCDRRLLHAASRRAIDAMAASSGREVKCKALKLASFEQWLPPPAIAALGKKDPDPRVRRDGREVARPLGSSVLSRWLGGASAATYCTPSGQLGGTPTAVSRSCPLKLSQVQASFAEWNRMTRLPWRSSLILEALTPVPALICLATPLA